MRQVKAVMAMRMLIKGRHAAGTHAGAPPRGHGPSPQAQGRGIHASSPRCAKPHARANLAAALLAWIALNLAAGGAQAEPVLELQMQASGRPLQLNRLGELSDSRQRALEVTRLDLLLSEFALQRPDGRWVPASGWHGFFRAEPPWRREPLRGLPAGEYVAARFAVGVTPKANHADPNRLRPDDPLHPVVNGLHWGWTGGYIFMALEGHWQFDHAPRGSTGGFSYHLAGNANRVQITLPAKLQLHDRSVLRLSLNAQRLLSGLDLVSDGDSTHSRSEDKVVRGLKAALRQAFTLAVAAGSTAPVATAQAAAAGQARGEPFPFTIGAHMPQVALPMDNLPTVPGVALGRALFHDPRLSRDGRVSCASCHRAAHALADGGQPVSRGVGGQVGTRNSMPLFNLAWAQDFFWDGRATGLRHQALLPIEHPKEMGERLESVLGKLRADPAMRRQFESAFGAPPSAERVGLALEQFMLTLVSQDSRFDQALRGGPPLSAQERRGQELFLTEHDPARGLRGADCFHCHGGNLFTHHRHANNGLVLRGNDTGRELVTGDPADRGKFKTPSLRNVALTAPYMHDGRLRTLEEVIEHYDRGVQRSPTLDPNLAKHPPGGLGLTREDKAALVAFLRSLTDPGWALGKTKLGAR